MAELAADCKKQGPLEEEGSEEVSVVTEEEVAELEEQFGSEGRRKSSIAEEGVAAAARSARPMNEIEGEVTEETHSLFRNRVQIRISQPSQDIGK